MKRAIARRRRNRPRALERSQREMDLPSGRRVEVEVRDDLDRLTIRGPNGHVLLRIDMTERLASVCTTRTTVEGDLVTVEIQKLERHPAGA